MAKSESHRLGKTSNQPRIYLKEWRMVHGLSQTEIAQRMGAEKSTVSRLEAGDRKLSIAWLEQYSRALGITREQLMSPPNVTMVRREEVVPITANSPRTPTAKPQQGVGPFGLSATPPYIFVVVSDVEHLLIDTTLGKVVARLKVEEDGRG